MAGQGFLRREVQKKKGQQICYLSDFPKNCIKMNNFGTGHVYHQLALCYAVP